MFDTRPLALRARQPWPGMRPLPLAAVEAGELPDAPLDATIYLVCDRGLVSHLVALYLEAAGFTDVRHLARGFGALTSAVAGKA